MAYLNTPRQFPKINSSSTSLFQSPHFTLKNPPPILYCLIKKETRSSKIWSIKWSAALRQRKQHVCKACEYVFPDPIPEFAFSETEKFSAHLLKKLSKKDIYGESVEEVVGICTEIFSKFLHTEYGGPGTLLVIPFIDMADTLNERGLPGGPQAARAAVVWAQQHVDKDWSKWTEGGGDSE